MTKKITLYVDIVSPFTYIAYYLTRTSPAFKDIQMTYIPILLGGIMQQASNKTPLDVKNKSEWINNQRERLLKQFQVPDSGTLPSPFPQSTVAAQRALCHVQAEHPDQLVPAIDALYEIFWVGNKSISKPETVVEGLSKVFGVEEAKRIVEQGAKSDGAKEALKRNTQLAWKDGAFGLPWFVATNEKGEKEGFFGVDHLGQLMDFLEVERVREGGWKALL